MAKRNNKNKKQHTPPATKPTPAPRPTTETIEEVLAKVEKTAMAHATEADLRAMEATPPPPPNTSGEELVRRAAEMVALLNAQRQRHDLNHPD